MPKETLTNYQQFKYKSAAKKWQNKEKKSACQKCINNGEEIRPREF